MAVQYFLNILTWNRSSTARHSRDAWMGNIFLISFHYHFDQSKKLSWLFFAKYSFWVPNKICAWELNIAALAIFFFNCRSVFCSCSGFPGLCAWLGQESRSRRSRSWWGRRCASWKPRRSGRSRCSQELSIWKTTLEEVAPRGTLHLLQRLATSTLLQK